ncbi:MAG TPA: c-type cytochrome [Actinomycetota bacterium]
MVRRRVLLSTAAAWIFLLAACTSTPGREPPPQVPGSDPQRGAQLIEQLGCGSCHVVPGVRGADGLVGPPLIHWSRRAFIAGELPNNATNLIRWLMDPQAVEPGTDMPNLHLSQAQARDIAAYLFGIQ